MTVPAPAPRRSDRAWLALVPAGFAAALIGTPWPVGVGLVGVVLTLPLLRPWLTAVALVLLVGARADASIDELRPAPTRPLEDTWAVLLSDPRPDDDSVTARARIEGHRVLLRARTVASGPFRTAAAGDRLLVSGVVRGSTPTSDWARSHGITGRVDVVEVGAIDRAGGIGAAANAYRRLLRDGARRLDRDRAALFTGIVFGDDRDQSPLTADDFRAAGLGHLLAVSGQNVVFVLLVVSPMLSRVRSLSARYGAMLAVLIAFGFVTRFEPSVMRALAMAAFAGAAAARGSPVTATLALPGAVLGLLLVDPLLAWSLAFRLSVAATLGLVLVAPPIAAALPGPRPVALTVAATAAAQLAVAPLLLVTVGGTSLVAVPANVLAAPAAAGVMMWGITAGTIAGMAPAPLASLLHVPTEIGVAWIQLVAWAAAAAPVRPFDGVALLVLGLGIAAAIRAPGLRRLGAAVVFVTLAQSIAAPTAPAPGMTTLAPGVELHRTEAGHDIVTVESGARTEATLVAVRHAQIARIDLLVVGGDRATGRVAGMLRQRVEIVDVWAPPGHQVPGARVWPARGACIGSVLVEPPVDPDDVGSVRIGAPRDRGLACDR